MNNDQRDDMSREVWGFNIYDPSLDDDDVCWLRRLAKIEDDFGPIVAIVVAAGGTFIPKERS